MLHQDTATDNDNEYELIGKVGQGTFGDVYKAKHVGTDRLVAIKRIRCRHVDDVIPLNVFREIKSLQHMQHPCVMELYEYREPTSVSRSSGTLVELILEYMSTDLHRILRNCVQSCRRLTAVQVKTILWNILQGVAALHAAHIMHRDLKPSNILFSPHAAQVKLGDFGLACLYDEHRRDTEYSHEVATRWYRAPELLYGARKYTPLVDTWAVGCIFGEMMNLSPLFAGENDIDQLHRVFSVLGTPSTDTWPDLTSLPDYGKISFPLMTPLPLTEVVPNASALALDLLSGLLAYGPSRLSAADALQHPYFHERPLPQPCARVLMDLVKNDELDKESRPLQLPTTFGGDTTSCLFFLNTNN